MKKEEIRKAINDFCSEKGLSKAAFAKMCGVSDATLSLIENEQWEKISDEMAQKIKSFIDQQKIDAIYQSTDFLSIFKACDAARSHHLMIGVVADTGVGKTTAVRTYSRQKNVFYVSFSKSIKATQFFCNLLREMGVSFSGTLYDMINRCAEELNRKEHPLVIIDEAGKITHPIMLYLQELRDRTLSNCGIILTGMPYFKAKLQKCAEKEKEGYAEFLRRINLWHTCKGLKPGEIAEICRLHNIMDPGKIKEFKTRKRFGDLMNDIYLYQVMNGVL